MDVNFRDSDPIPHLTFPLKGKELGKLALMGESRNPVERCTGHRLSPV